MIDVEQIVSERLVLREGCLRAAREAIALALEALAVQADVRAIEAAQIAMLHESEGDSVMDMIYDRKADAHQEEADALRAEAARYRAGAKP